MHLFWQRCTESFNVATQLLIAPIDLRRNCTTLFGAVAFCMIKITRRTTGAQGIYFLTSVYQVTSGYIWLSWDIPGYLRIFLAISSYLCLFLAIASRDTSYYFVLSVSILRYFWLSYIFSSYHLLYHAIWWDLVLSCAISRYHGLSWVISG